MFEHHSEPLLSRWTFAVRFGRNFLAGIGIILGSLVIGMIGYQRLESMTWTDAFLNASMLLSGMGPISAPRTESGKLFAGLYALYSGFIVLFASGIVFAPVLHRLFHKFHLASEHHARGRRAKPPQQESMP